MRSSYVVLLRGINVGGKNKVPMAELRATLEGVGFSNVSTYIASGNVLLDAELSAGEVAANVEAALPKAFKLHTELIRVAVFRRRARSGHLRETPPWRNGGFSNGPSPS